MGTPPAREVTKRLMLCWPAMWKKKRQKEKERVVCFFFFFSRPHETRFEFCEEANELHLTASAAVAVAAAVVVEENDDGWPSVWRRVSPLPERALLARPLVVPDSILNTSER